MTSTEATHNRKAKLSPHSGGSVVCRFEPTMLNNCSFGQLCAQVAGNWPALWSAPVSLPATRPGAAGNGTQACAAGAGLAWWQALGAAGT